MDAAALIFLFFIGFLLWMALSIFVIIPQKSVGLLMRLGKAVSVFHAGIHIILPIVERTILIKIEDVPGLETSSTAEESKTILINYAKEKKLI